MKSAVLIFVLIFVGVAAIRVLDESAKRNGEMFREGLDPVSRVVLEATDFLFE
jgi:hypothetical protein